MEGHPFLTILFGQQGLVFNLALPLAIYSLIPAAVICCVAWVIAGLRKTEWWIDPPRRREQLSAQALAW